MDWYNATNTIGSQEYRCGYCGLVVASSSGYYTRDNVGGQQAFIRVCPHCTKPTFMHIGVQVPGVAPGNDVEHLPNDVASLYNEARNCIAASCYTASVLVSRKLLMNIAVSLKAEPGRKFIEYVDYLAGHNYVPPNGRGWVDHIRKKGNEATHEIILMGRDDAAELVSFTEMLLKFIFEFPARVPQLNV